MDITKLYEHTPQKMAEIIMQDDEYIFTTWGKKSCKGLADMIRQAPDPDLLTLARMGLKLAELVIDAEAFPPNSNDWRENFLAKARALKQEALKK